MAQGIITEADIHRKVGNFPGLSYHYGQIRHLLDKLAQKGSLFRPLTDFERFLDSETFVHTLSMVYQLLTMQERVMDWWEEDLVLG